jgi:vacuolar-type H+-ATPase subunit E/Vma4
MSTEGLKKAVLDRARSEAAGILAQARAEIEANRARALDEARKSAEQIVLAAQQKSAQDRQQALAAQEREMGLESLAARNHLLDEAFRQAAAAFKALPAKELYVLYNRELEDLDLEDATVFVPLHARSDFEGLLNGRARVEEDPSLEAGYVVARKDYRLDRSLAARMEEIRAELRPQVAELLFGNEP